MLVFSHFFQGRQALALLAGPTPLGRCGWGGFIQGGIQAQTGNHANWIFQLAQLPQQLNHGKTAVGDDYQQTVRQPATSLQDQLTCPLGELLMLSSLPCVIPLRRRQNGEKRQSPDAFGPRHGRQQH